MTTKLPKLPELQDTQLTRSVQAYAREAVADALRPCTCPPDDNPPIPCAKKYALADCRAASPTGDNAEHVRVLGNALRQTSALRSPEKHAALSAAIAALSQPSVAVTELTERQRKVVEFALSRFIREAYWRASEAAQKSTAVYFASDALERLLNDAKDAEQALATLSQGGKP